MTDSVNSERRQRYVPRATYRFQFNRDFTLRQAIELVPYLHELGISHVYASPLLKACAGSTHGYDVCDCSQLNPEIGTDAELESFVKELHSHGMGLVLDIVPNHMAASSENPWWWDVLKNGQASRYANHFDIDWHSSDPKLSGKILVPVLADELEHVIEQNQLTLEIENSAPILRYFDHKFPLAPESALTSQPQINAVNGNPRKLSALLEKQNYLLTFWKHGDEQINYRRFFNISTLAGVRVEDEQVFQDTHALVLDWYQRGFLDGLRIDHPDGLRDPQSYLKRLRQAAPDVWIVVEKILEPGEQLPPDWPVNGTTGYDFLNRNNGVFIDQGSEKVLTEFYHKFTGESVDYQSMVQQKKRWALENLLAAELDRLVNQWQKIIAQKQDNLARPVESKTEVLREAIINLMICLPVYRTYIQAARSVPANYQDQHWLTEALKHVSNMKLRADSDRIASLLDLLQRPPANDLEADFIMRFQQLSGPVMAKGVEDTSFYCFNRFVALNEVGGDPGHFGLSIEEFHTNCAEAAKYWPDAMLASSTHDTKRSKDVRSRLALLSEIPDQWINTVQRWLAMNEPHHQHGFPDRNAEYLFYQTLVGAWPLSADRAKAYMKKASCEAKQYTNWTEPNAVYDEALNHFVTGTMNDKMFMADVEQFVSLLNTAGQINSLAQTLIKLTAPGVPDIYQGNELWDLSLVDPDNRRPVDFQKRKELLKEANQLSAEQIWQRREKGLPKLWLIQQVLNVRKHKPDWFKGIYKSLSVLGAKANHVVAFQHGKIITIVPRFNLSLRGEWQNTLVELPSGNWLNTFTQKTFSEKVSPTELFQEFPVALLIALE